MMDASYATVDVVTLSSSTVAVAQWEPASMSLGSGLRMLVIGPKLLWKLGYKKSKIMLSMFATLEAKRHEVRRQYSYVRGSCRSTPTTKECLRTSTIS